MNADLHIIIAGGGTGGHVFPAIAIADAIRELQPQAKILFIGSSDRLEMRKVPEAGYEIVGLKIKGLKRSLSLENLKAFWLLLGAVYKTRRIFARFKPSVVIGVGGYASAPALQVAVRKDIPIVLQEQNSYPGITNRYFARYAKAIFVAYEQTKKYLPAEKVYNVGNPLRKEFLRQTATRQQAAEYFGLDPHKKTLLVTGGSLGARTLNQAVMNNLQLLQKTNIQVIWQTGKLYYDQILQQVQPDGWLKIMPFIEKMFYAYTLADLVIARAGAITISELSLLGKPVIFVPSPNVAEDHQTKNAQALVDDNAALMVRDGEAEEQLIPLAVRTITDDQLLSQLSENIKKFARPNAAYDIAKFILQLKK